MGTMFYTNRVAGDKPEVSPAFFEVVHVGTDSFVYCPIRNRSYSVKSKPEEIVRQWWLYQLRDQYGYSWDQISVEVPVIVGSTEGKKAADIVVYSDSTKATPRIFIEVKKPERMDGLEQLKVYMNATGCRLGMWSNGTSSSVSLLRVEPKEFEEEATWRELRNIPSAKETLSDVDNPITRADLRPVDDFLSILRDCENYIKAHEGSNPFDEIFKLIFAKLYDERRTLKNDTSAAKFRIGAMESSSVARDRINELFVDAKSQWVGVFLPSDEINLGDDSLAYAVSALQMSYLLKSDADVLGAAFEIMINPSMKGDKGQYFTPRHVVDLCVEVIQPRDNETVFDPACGSGGFLVGAMDFVFKAIAAERDDESETLENQKDFASSNVFGLDYDPMIAKVAKAYMLIWGDGRSNICVADGLNENNWGDDVKSRFLTKQDAKSSLRQFDIILSNPPFAGAISSPDTLGKYSLAYKVDGKGKKKRSASVSRDVLFIERTLNTLAPGGRMAIVLPRGILKNYGDEYIRKFILERAQVRAVVGLTGSMFKPFTNTKTCVVFLQKRQSQISDMSEALDDPEVIFAVSQKPGKDRSGHLIRNEDGVIVSDLGEISAYLQENLDWNGK